MVVERNRQPHFDFRRRLELAEIEQLTLVDDRSTAAPVAECWPADGLAVGRSRVDLHEVVGIKANEHPLAVWPAVPQTVADPSGCTVIVRPALVSQRSSAHHQITVQLFRAITAQLRRGSRTQRRPAL